MCGGLSAPEQLGGGWCGAVSAPAPHSAESGLEGVLPEPTDRRQFIQPVACVWGFTCLEHSRDGGPILLNRCHEAHFSSSDSLLPLGPVGSHFTHSFNLIGYWGRVKYMDSS